MLEVDPSGSLILVGSAIMVLSGGITSYANILMKIDAIKLATDPSPSFIIFRKYVAMAVCLYVIGGLADLVALGLVPLSLRACSSVLTIPFNAVFAKAKLGEDMSLMQMLGAGITVFGCLVAMLFAANQTIPIDTGVVDLLFTRKVALFAVWTLPVSLLGMLVMHRALPKRGAVEFSSRFRKLGVLAAATWTTSYQCAWTNLFIKAIAMLVQEKEWKMGYLVLLAALTGASAVMQMILMSSMMQLFESVVVIPPYQILITTWIVVFSSVIFGDHPSNIAGFTASLLFSFFGIILVAFSAPPVPLRSESPDREPLVMMTERI